MIGIPDHGQGDHGPHRRSKCLYKAKCQEKLDAAIDTSEACQAVDDQTDGQRSLSAQKISEPAKRKYSQGEAPKINTQRLLHHVG